MVKMGALLGPLVWLVSPKVELCEDKEDSFSWRLVKFELLQFELSLPTDRPAIGAWKATIAAA